MVVFEVSVNGQIVALAGQDDLGVLSAIVNAVGVLGPNSKGTYKIKEGFELYLSVGGKGSNTIKSEEEKSMTKYLNLKIGDEVTVKILWKPIDENQENLSEVNK